MQAAQPAVLYAVQQAIRTVEATALQSYGQCCVWLHAEQIVEDYTSATVVASVVKARGILALKKFAALQELFQARIV